MFIVRAVNRSALRRRAMCPWKARQLWLFTAKQDRHGPPSGGRMLRPIPCYKHDPPDRVRMLRPIPCYKHGPPNGGQDATSDSLL